MARRYQNPQTSIINWDRVRSIFDYPKPPKKIWQKQFDGDIDILQRLASTPYKQYKQISEMDMSYYHDDLAFVDLQPDLFAYMFPVCLMNWHDTLMRNEDYSPGNSDFHFAVSHGKIFEKMLTQKQRDAVYEFFHDSFLERLDAEERLVYSDNKTRNTGWIYRFNSLGKIIPNIERIWQAWWSFNTPGRAIAGLKYCSGLMYNEGENPLFEAWTAEHGGGGPYLLESDCSIYDTGWLNENIKFLKKSFTIDFVSERVAAAIHCLKSESEKKLAQQLLNDLPERNEIISSRIAELPNKLSQSFTHDGLAGWAE